MQQNVGKRERGFAQRCLKNIPGLANCNVASLFHYIPCPAQTQATQGHSLLPIADIEQCVLE